MNESQKKLLILSEFEFYRLMDPSSFDALVRKTGLPDPRASSFSLDSYQAINKRLRELLRKPS